MKIRKYFSLDNDVYKVAFYTQDWSQGDKDLMAEFGEPEIDLGGNFDDGGALEFDLPSNLVTIMSASPFTQDFDIRDEADSEDRAELWATTIAARLVSAVTTLRTNTNDYSREEVQTV